MGHPVIYTPCSSGTIFHRSLNTLINYNNHLAGVSASNGTYGDDEDSEYAAGFGTDYSGYGTSEGGYYGGGGYSYEEEDEESDEDDDDAEEKEEGDNDKVEELKKGVEDLLNVQS